MKCKVQEKIGLDALTICCKEREMNRLFGLLQESGKQIIKWNNEEGETPFFTVPISENDNEKEMDEVEEDEDKVSVTVNIGEPGQAQKLGTLCVHKTKKGKGKYDGLSFLHVENRALYTGLFKHTREILNALGLVYNNMSRITPCLTTTRHLKNRFKRLLRGTDEYEMFWFGDKVKNPYKLLDCLCYIGGGSRKKESPNKSIVVNSGDKLKTNDALEKRYYRLKLRIYDKGDQLYQVIYTMDYLDDFLCFEQPYINLYRCEVDIFNTVFRVLCKELGVEHDESVLDLICEEEFLRELLRKSIHHLFYWRKDGREINFV